MSDELTSALRDLATEGERPPALSGAEIRDRAKGRRRRRRAAWATAGASVAGVLALVAVTNLGGTSKHVQPPATSPTVSASPPVAPPDATIDLGRRVIAVAGRRLTLHYDNLPGSAPTVRTTVSSKEASRKVSSTTVGLGGGYSFKATWVVELTAPDGTTDYVGALGSGGESFSDPDHGWIGLDAADAKQLYERLALGSVVELRFPSGPSSPSTVSGGPAGQGSGTGTSP
ncbi:hypothetical protein [Streptomyces sp. NPDC127038]|uniref:hypothetical protein n=1 Tax=Streptomyces sp. NPDC127038 TaxID=3347114 RepID=UPI0036662750